MSYSEIFYPLGANNTSLTVDNTQLRGIGWVAGGGGGGINAVNGGNNIDVNTVNNVATVSLETPLTQPLDIGTQNITGTTSNIILTNNAATIEMGGNGIVPTNYSYAGINRQDNGNLVIQNTAPNNGDIQLNTTNGIVSSNSALQVPAIRDAGGLTGANNQVLSAGAGGTLLWVNQGGGGGGITQVNPGNNIDVATQGSIATVSLKAPLTTNLDMGAVDITTSTVNGEIEMVLNGDGRFVVSQNSAGGDNLPAMTIQNQNGNATEVHIDLYKNSASPQGGDGIGAISFHGNNNQGAKTQYALLQANLINPSSQLGSSSLSLYAKEVASGQVLEYLRANGQTNKVELLNNTNLLGSNPILGAPTATTLTIDTVNSGGNPNAGNITINAKSTLSLITPNTQPNPGSILLTTDALQMNATTQITVASPLEIHTGIIQTNDPTFIYRPTLQPSLTQPTYTLNETTLIAEGQNVNLINNTGTGGNDLTTVATADFQIMCSVWTGFAYLVAGRYIDPNGGGTYLEVRFAATLTAILSNDQQQYSVIRFDDVIGIPSSDMRVNAIFFDPINYPNCAVIGGYFEAYQASPYRPGGQWPSAVKNILVINIAGFLINPFNMLFTGSPSTYGLNDEVYCFCPVPMTQAMGNPQNPGPQVYVVAGGRFTDTLPSQGGLQVLAFIRIDLQVDNSFEITQYFGIIVFANQQSPPANTGVRFIGIGDAPAQQSATTRIILGGDMGNFGGNNWTSDNIAITYNTYWNNTQGGWLNVIFAPPTPFYNLPPISAGWFAGNPYNNLTYYLSIFNPTNNQYEVITADFTPIGAPINDYAIIAFVLQNLPSGGRVSTFGLDYTANPSLQYVIGSGNQQGQTAPAFCYETSINEYLGLGGAPNFQNLLHDVPNNRWLFFREPLTYFQNYSEEITNTAGQVVITTALPLHFTNGLAPSVSYQNITLGSTNNFALGVYVGHNTNDRRILITSQHGATFS